MSARAETGPHCRCVRLTCPVLSSRCILCTDPHLGGVTMLRRVSVLALALALALAACGDNGGPTVASPDQLQLRIVSGDRLVARVAEAAASQNVGLYRTAATVPDNVLPEPLVARILIDGAPTQASLVSGDPTGPRFAVLPPNVAVIFRVIQPQNAGNRHCGASFIDAAVPDDSGYVVTFWEKGTRAGECRMQVRLVVDRQPRV